MNKYTTLLFDADDTLLDFDKDETQALKKVMTHYGVPVTDKNISIYKEINLGLWNLAILIISKNNFPFLSSNPCLLPDMLNG